jgi:acetyltransferase-like isoleucine patch superfamily enzyme
MLTDLSKLKYLGENVKIYELAKLVKEEVIEIGDGTQIDDFVFINGGKGIKLGRYNHIASFTTIIGGGELITGDYVGMAAGCRIITGTHHYGNGKRMVQTVPREQQEVIIGKIVLEKDVFLASNVVVFPNVTIGEGAIISAGSLVVKDVKPWTINVGMPARVVGDRPKVLYE